jgi:hypothetical protein
MLSVRFEREIPTYDELQTITLDSWAAVIGELIRYFEMERFVDSV